MNVVGLAESARMLPRPGRMFPAVSGVGGGIVSRHCIIAYSHGPGENMGIPACELRCYRSCECMIVCEFGSELDATGGDWIGERENLVLRLVMSRRNRPGASHRARRIKIRVR